MENCFSRKDLSKTKRSFLPSFQIKPYGLRCKRGKNLCSQNRNTSACFLLFFAQVSLYIGNGLGHEDMVAACVVLHALFCGDVAYERCGAVIV